MSVPVVCETIEFVEPRIGWNVAFGPKDKVRWANLYSHLRKQGLTPEKAENQAFQRVWELRYNDLKY